jgi:hypothetical protein
VPHPDQVTSIREDLLSVPTGTALRLAQYLIKLPAERPVRDIARSHEFVIDLAPDAAGPVTAAPARDCIFEVGVAVMLADDFPRERRADSSEQFHRYSPKSHPDADERYPYRSDIKAFPHTK